MLILNDFSTTVKKALHEIDPYYEQYPGLVICGTHTPNNIEYMIKEIKEARENGTPFLGICFGHQLAWIEYNRHVLGIKNATSEEFLQVDETHSRRKENQVFVVRKRGQLKVGLHDGETYWNNYECTIDEKNPFWEKAENFITTQSHPEYQSSKNKPHPLLVKFMELCKK